MTGSAISAGRHNTGNIEIRYGKLTQVSPFKPPQKPEEHIPMTTTIRDPQGRFRLGTAAGPGRPPRATEQNYLLAVLDACPLETWAEIVEKAVSAAREGDDKARHWLASYLLGAPKGNAPAPSAALVGRMLGEDAVLTAAARRLAKPLASAEMFPILEADSARFRELELEAKQYILALEAETP